MRALSFHRPWPALILLDHPLRKNIENRCWDTKHRGEFAVHAAKKWDPFARATVRQVGLPDDIISWDPEDHPTGLVGVADLTGVCTPICRLSCECGPWESPGSWHWQLAERVTVLPEPVPCRGNQSWWHLPPDVADAVERQLAVAR